MNMNAHRIVELARKLLVASILAKKRHFDVACLCARLDTTSHPLQRFEIHLIHAENVIELRKVVEIDLPSRMLQGGIVFAQNGERTAIRALARMVSTCPA